jgi:hypothetical protein
MNLLGDKTSLRFYYQIFYSSHDYAIFTAKSYPFIVLYTFHVKTNVKLTIKFAFMLDNAQISICRD